MQVLVNNHVVSYESKGTGPVVLMLHGWADTKNTFQPVLHEFTKYRVIAVDLPGFGGSGAPDTAWGLPEYAQFTADFLKKIHIDPHKLAIVIGHSNGGAVAVYGIAHNNFSVDKLILLSAAGIRSSDAIKKQLLKFTAKTGKVLTFVLPKNQKQKLKATFYKKIKSDLLIAPHMHETFKKIVSHDVLQDSQKIKIPTLLIYGNQDAQTPLHYGQKFAAVMPHSKLITINGAGHFMHQTHTEQVSNAIQDFLK